MNNKQSISLGSIQNARELGGYTTAEGRRIKNGLLLRTARLNNIEACKKGNRKTATGNRAFVPDCMNKDQSSGTLHTGLAEHHRHTLQQGRYARQSQGKY